MDDSTNWRASLSFSDRFTSIVEISAAHKKAAPGLSDGEARQRAKADEDHIFKTASNLTEYEERCSSLVADIQGNAQSEPPEDGQFQMNEEFDAGQGITIGQYEHAVYHQNGITSTVYKASRRKQGLDSEGTPRLVALKVAELAGLQPPHDFRREIRVLRRVASSNIIPLLEDFPLSGTRHVLVFPFMRYDLPGLVSNGPRFSQGQRKRCLRDLFSALAHLHSLGVIHRDVKPSNILLDSADGPAYLADFGIVWDPNDSASEPAEAKITDVGTTCYRPLELLFGDASYGPTLDLWAAGCVVAELVDSSIGTLFDAGDLGSELALIHSIFKKLGTPTLETWPEAAKMPDWGKIQFWEYPANPWHELLPRASSLARDLVSKLVVYESGERMAAAKVLDHPFFEDV